MGQYDALLKPLQIKNLTIRNRFLSTSHCPNHNHAGRPSERYIRYHEEKARGGIGLTQFGGATGISPENSYHYGQLVWRTIGTEADLALITGVSGGGTQESVLWLVGAFVVFGVLAVVGYRRDQGKEYG